MTDKGESEPSSANDKPIPPIEEIPEASAVLEVIEQLPVKEQEPFKRAVASMYVEIKRESFKSPVPPPSYLEQYEHILPGSANRMLQMAEEQLRHRHSLERAVVFSNIARERMGQIFGFIAVLIILFGGIFLMINGKDAQGFSLILTSGAAFAGIFYVARNIRQKELQAQRQALIETPKPKVNKAPQSRNSKQPQKSKTRRK